MSVGNIFLIKNDNRVGRGIVESRDEMGILGDDDPFVCQLGTHFRLISDGCEDAGIRLARMATTSTAVKRRLKRIVIR